MGSPCQSLWSVCFEKRTTLDEPWFFQDDDKLSDPNSCFQPSVERNFKIALLLNWCFLLKGKTQHLSQPIRRKVKHKYYLSADSVPALSVSLVYWVKNTVHCCDWSVKEIWVLKNAISVPSSTTVNPRVGTWFLRTCKAKICQLVPLYTRTCLALNLKQVFLFSKMYNQKSVYLG